MSDMQKRKVLFVCTGNTCRSCMAEGIFRAMVQTGSTDIHYTAKSCGIYANEGDRASDYSVQALRNLWGIDISDHRARMMDKLDLAEAGLILTMTRQHRDILRQNIPGDGAQIYTLKEYVYPEIDGKGLASDITDPFGMSFQSYEKCAKEIYKCIQLLIDKLH